MSCAGCFVLFVTCDVRSTIIDKVLHNPEKPRQCETYVLAQREETLPCSYWGGPSGSAVPVDSTWKSPFLGYSVEQCWEFLKTVVPGSKHDEESPDFDPREQRDHYRFALLDDTFVETGKLLICTRETQIRDDMSFETGRFLMLRREPDEAATILAVCYQDQWEIMIQDDARKYNSVKAKLERAAADMVKKPGKAIDPWP